MAHSVDDRFAKLLNHQDHDLLIDGLTILCQDKVFSPDPQLSYSSTFLLKNIPDVTGKTVLDIGSGTGIIALRCAKNGASKVVATDVSEVAIENIKTNAERLHLSQIIDVRQSNLFSNVIESFDYIFANLPILDETWSQESGNALRLAQIFLGQLQDHLRPAGTAYLTWGSFADVEPLRKSLQGLDMNVQESREEALGYTWYLFAISRR